MHLADPDPDFLEVEEPVDEFRDLPLDPWSNKKLENK
jgi:hypothetical protein